MRPFRLGKRVWEQAMVAKRHDERSYKEKIQARANSTQEASVQSGANHQVVHAPVAQRPKRTVREPAYLKDYLH
ncbi:hypothetical protein pdam_00000715 [Pocillopora damicornis]|uniref:Uncharacterized protein n=1 Tax=Pocillopora damicornis TaxID=46731 RepID=A0A3M6TYE0_POCDA|nr:hypothetical protein pdam_00000715 [Pocillopora damicornis]